jgi:predicted lipoprotein with Yx(FWY)xxD motif
MRRMLLVALSALAATALPAPAATAWSASSAGPAPQADDRERADVAAAKKKKGVKLRVGTSRFGKVLMNGAGKALYLFTKDRKGPSECYEECATAWPPFLTKGKPVAGKGLEARKLGTTLREDGRRQVTYGGHPVYFYIHDSPGVILCQDVFEFGGRWLLVDAAGKAVR